MVSRPRFLLLQARRPSDAELAGERQLFADCLGVPTSNVAGHNMVESLPPGCRDRSYDAILIGGSGDYYVSNGEFPRHRQLLERIRELAEGPTPIFASCFGFQLLTAALGGEVVHDPETMELGTYQVTLTAAGAEDELLGSLPGGFMAQLGRKDRAVRLPPGVENLARSERCPLQAFRLGPKPVWATQFHPELDAETNRGRYLAYLENYSGYLDEESREQVLARFRPSPATGVLLRRFVEVAL